MLLSKNIEIKAGNKLKYYKELGYNISSSKEFFQVNIEHLTKGNNAIIQVSCDYCGQLLNIPYRRYIKYTSVCDKYSCSKVECSNQKIKDVCLIKYGVENPFQADFVKEKSKNTFIEKYGVSHQMYIQEVKDKIKKTCLNKYGVEHPSQNDKVIKKTKITNILKYGFDHDNKLESQKEKRKNTRIENGRQLPDNMRSLYFLYRRQIDNISDILKYKLLDNWDGFDYYDNEYIKDNFNLSPNDKNYPTLDHKISVYYGFLNDISVEEISKIENLCFTKNYLNCRKGRLTELEFKRKPQTD